MPLCIGTSALNSIPYSTQHSREGPTMALLYALPQRETDVVAWGTLCRAARYQFASCNLCKQDVPAGSRRCASTSCSGRSWCSNHNRHQHIKLSAGQSSGGQPRALDTVLHCRGMTVQVILHAQTRLDQSQPYILLAVLFGQRPDLAVHSQGHGSANVLSCLTSASPQVLAVLFGQHHTLKRPASAAFQWQTLQA